MRALTGAAVLCAALLSACGDGGATRHGGASATTPATATTATDATTSGATGHTKAKPDTQPRATTTSGSVPPPTSTTTPDSAASAAAATAAEKRRVRAVAIEAVTTTDPSSCTRLVTRRYVEQSTGQRGAAALRSCRDDADRAGAKTVSIDRVAVDGATAEVDMRPRGGDIAMRTVTLRLVKAGGRWKVDGLVRGTLDRPEFQRVIRQQLDDAKSPLPAATIDCMVADLRTVSDGEIERALIAADQRPYVISAAVCSVVAGLGDQGVSSSVVSCIKKGIRGVLSTGALGRKLTADPRDPGLLQSPAFAAAARRVATACARKAPAKTTP
jgi:hypothetical protein